MSARQLQRLLRSQTASRYRLVRAARNWLRLVSATEGTQGWRCDARNRDGVMLRAEVTVTYWPADDA